MRRQRFAALATVSRILYSFVRTRTRSWRGLPTCRSCYQNDIGTAPLVACRRDHLGDTVGPTGVGHCHPHAPVFLHRSALASAHPSPLRAVDQAGVGEPEGAAVVSQIRSQIPGPVPRGGRASVRAAGTALAGSRGVRRGRGWSLVSAASRPPPARLRSDPRSDDTCAWKRAGASVHMRLQSMTGRHPKPRDDRTETASRGESGGSLMLSSMIRRPLCNYLEHDPDIDKVWRTHLASSQPERPRAGRPRM